MKSVPTRRRARRPQRVLGMIAALVLLSTACGGSSDNEPASAEPQADVTIEVTIVDNTISGVDQRVEVELGSIVELTITSDVDEEIHIHGYDEFVTLVAGEPAVLTFEASIPGVFEAELEGRGQRVTEFEVS